MQQGGLQKRLGGGSMTTRFDQKEAVSFGVLSGCGIRGKDSLVLALSLSRRSYVRRELGSRVALSRFETNLAT